MLLAEHPRGKLIGRVARQHRHHGLCQYQTVVQLSRHLMDGHTGKLATGVNGALVGTHTTSTGSSG